MSDYLFFDDEAGELTLTQRTGPDSENILRFHVSEISRFDYKRPGFFGAGTLQFHLTSGISTEVISVSKAHKTLFDQLVNALNQISSQLEKANYQTSSSVISSSRNQSSNQTLETANDFEQRLILKKEILGLNEFVAVDVEWTDSRSHDSVCEIGLAKFIRGELSESYRAYVKPQKRFEMGHFEKATHGIDRSLIENALTLQEQWPLIQEFIGGRPLVLHQATNDINKVLSSIGDKAPHLVSDFLYLDTMLIAKKMPWITSKNGLSELSKFFNIERTWAIYDGREELEQPHGALEDAIATGELLLQLMAMVGYETLLGFTELIGTEPGYVQNATIQNGASAPGKINWPHIEELPEETALLKKFDGRLENYRKSQDKKAKGTEITQEFLSQTPIPWSNKKVSSGQKVYFSSFHGEGQTEIWKVAEEMGLQFMKFNAQIELLIIDDESVFDSGRLRNALTFKNPVPVTNYSNFQRNNPSFPPKTWYLD